MIRRLFLMITLSLSAASLSAVSGYATGPLITKNSFVPHLLFMHLTGTPAGLPPTHTLTFGNAVYYSQALNVYLKKDATGHYVEENDELKIFRSMDFESAIFETSIAYTLSKRFQVGCELRLIGYYGGVLDEFTSWWHDVFNFPNGGREFVPNNAVYVDAPTHNGMHLHLKEPALSFGDIDMWVKFNIFSNKTTSFTFINGFKIPTGQLKYLSGSGTPDILLGILLDWTPIRYLGFYAQTAVSFPLIDAVYAHNTVYPSFNGIAAFEIAPFNFFSFISQFHFKTTHFKSDIYIYDKTKIYADFLSLPQANLIFGVVFSFASFKLQISFEEDAFTDAGVDYTIGLSVSKSFRLK